MEKDLKSSDRSLIDLTDETDMSILGKTIG
jgi:hypothetical protein